MKFEDLVHGKQSWLHELGPDADIVFSSRIRIARNLRNRLFPNRATPSEKKEILGKIIAVVKKINYFRNSIILKMDELEEIDKQFLSERYLISRELAAMGSGSAVVIDNKEMISLMINEEDHIRMQVLLSGFRLRECWDIINDIDNQLESNLNFAFSPDLGYLTACPTNIGTGIRVSAMLHLPALILIKQIDQVLQAIVKLGLAVRGLYGEGTDVFGNLFQISNQVTLGKSEEEIISSLEKVIRQVVQSEKNARSSLLKTSAEIIYDKVGRAYGILSNAHLITSRETIDHLSALRMGVDLSIIDNVDRSAINELFILTQPAHLQKINRKRLDANMRDIERGNLLRNKLRNN